MTGATYLWQNFLNNPKIIEFIIQDIKDNCDLKLQNIEVWPWKCALTEYLWFVENLKLFEKDETFYEWLQKCVNKKNIIMWDFLSANLEEHIKTDFFNCFWNLPYYITSPIFKKLTNPENKVKMKYWIFMIQKEVGEKIINESNKKTMLSFLLQYNYKITYLKTVPAKDFTPAPKVDSCLVRFEYTWWNDDLNFWELTRLLTVFTAYKRKTLWKIEKILQKQWHKIFIPEELKSKRFTVLTFDEIRQIKLVETK